MSTPFLSAVVHQIRPEAAGVVSVELRPEGDDRAFPAFSAGAHIDLHLPNGISRSYSLCNDPRDEGRYVIGVAHDRHSRGGSAYVHRQLAPGTRLRISAPRNNFRLDESAERYVLLAGGIGVTPLVAMFRRLEQLRKHTSFIYCARSRSEAAFVEQIESLANERSQVVIRFDDEAGGPPDVRALLAGVDERCRLYCCGPAPMLDAFVTACDALRLPHASIERFSAQPPDAAPTANAYTLELRRSGKTLDVPAGKTPLRVMLEAGLPVDFGCEEGVCGACESRVLEGIVDHRDSLLGKAEKASNKTMLICVSGCKSQRLVLDL